MSMLAALAALAVAAAPPLYRDARQPITARLDDLVERLTQSELMAQLSGPKVAGVPRLNISGAAFMGECLAGLGAVNVSTSWPMPVALGASFDEALVARLAHTTTHLGRGRQAAAAIFHPTVLAGTRPASSHS
jgi:hypothetical protein